MSGSADGPRPTPAIVPRRRPTIPPAPRVPARSKYQVASDLPRRGLEDARVWPDTGILLGLGADQDLLDRFRDHYRSRIRIAQAVERELRWHANLPRDGLAGEEYDRVSAAARSVRNLLVGDGRLQVVVPDFGDLQFIEIITQQLKGFSDVPRKGHGGEAEIIALASGLARQDGRKHVLLTNDGGASVIAGRHGISSRHIGDVLVEFACADPALDPAVCLRAFQAAVLLSAPPVQCRQSSAADFACARLAAACAACDALTKVS
jgi:hypothetical protein